MYPTSQPMVAGIDSSRPTTLNWMSTQEWMDRYLKFADPEERVYLLYLKCHGLVHPHRIGQ